MTEDLIDHGQGAAQLAAQSASAVTLAPLFRRSARLFADRVAVV